jgi:hypothetical protein
MVRQLGDGRRQVTVLTFADRSVTGRFTSSSLVSDGNSGLAGDPVVVGDRVLGPREGRFLILG